MYKRMKRFASGCACAAGLTCAGVSAGPTVYLNFGSATETSTKATQTIHNSDGTTLVTMKKGPRLGFVPTDVGYANNDDRAAIIQQIVNKITAKFMGLNITFVTEQPAMGEYETIHYVAGGFPTLNFPADGNGVSLSYNPNTMRLTIMGGDQNGWYYDTATGRLHRADGTATNTVDPGMRDWPTKTGTLGIAQRLDDGDAQKADHAWVFVGSHNMGMGADGPNMNRNELANSAAHELAHLLGLVHEDGEKNSVMGDLNTWGTDKDFTDGSNNNARNAKRKLRGVLRPKAPVPERARAAEAGKTDQHGTSKPSGVPTGNDETDAADRLKQGRSYLAPHTTDAPHPISMFDVQPGPGDPPGINTLLPDGSVLAYNLVLDEPGPIEGNLVDAWIELTVANVVNTNPNPVAHTRVGVPTAEFVGALAGVDQRYLDDEVEGYALSQRFTFFLDSFLSAEQIHNLLMDGQMQFVIVVGDGSPFISVDRVRLFVVDRGSVVCPGDTNGDGVVDFADFSTVLAEYGMMGTGLAGDLNNDGVVDFADFSEVLAHYGVVCK